MLEWRYVLVSVRGKLFEHLLQKVPIIAVYVEMLAWLQRHIHAVPV